MKKIDKKGNNKYTEISNRNSTAEMVIVRRYRFKNDAILTPSGVVKVILDHLATLKPGEILQINFEEDCIWETRVTDTTIRDDPGHLDTIEMADKEVYNFVYDSSQPSLRLVGKIPTSVVNAMNDISSFA